MLNKTVRLIILFILICVQIFLHAKENTFQKTLVKIGSREISVKEFLERTEFTIRPSKFRDKKISLNNLIAEKLLALEAEATGNPILYNPNFNSRLKGLKEQEMRDLLYKEAAADKVNPDSARIYEKYMLSIREYTVEYYRLKDETEAGNLSRELSSGSDADLIFSRLEKSTGRRPVKTVKYLDPDDEAITDALFTTLLDTGAVIGPFKLINGEHIVLRVVDWADHLLLGGKEQRERWGQVEAKIKKLDAARIWNRYVSDIINGKVIDFNEEVFNRITEQAYKYYSARNQPDSIQLVIEEIPSIETIVKDDEKFFTIGNETWTAGDFKKELLTHPLVFRTKFYDSEGYKRQFFYAAADMMRDHFLTKEAYKKSLDKSAEVQSKVELWRDSFLATEQQRKIFSDAFEQGIVKQEDNQGRLKFWGTYLNELQDKYSSIIEINQNELEKLALTTINFMAIQPGVPYPALVPGFPIFTTSAEINYTGKEVSTGDHK